MEFQYYGANCVRITSKKANIVIDDNLSSLGLKSVTKPDDIALYTAAHEPVGARLILDQPGEYEASEASIQGIAARAHMDEEGQKNAVMFKITTSDLRIAAVGHIHPDLSEDQLESLGTVDILIIPVGGSGYTLDPIGALKVIKDISPKIVIPTHFADKSVNYPMPQVALDDALRDLSMEPTETLAKLKLKSTEFSDTAAQLIVLERQ